MHAGAQQTDRCNQGALRSLGTILLEDYLKGCVVNSIQDQGNVSGMIEQVVEVFNKFSK